MSFREVYHQCLSESGRKEPVGEWDSGCFEEAPAKTTRRDGTPILFTEREKRIIDESMQCGWLDVPCLLGFNKDPGLGRYHDLQSEVGNFERGQSKKGFMAIVDKGKDLFLNNWAAVHLVRDNFYDKHGN